MSRYYWNRKDAVEDCMVLDIGDLKRRGGLKPREIGAISWSRGTTPAGSISYVSLEEGLVVMYAMTIRATGQKIDEKYAILIRRTPGGFGGEQLWFACPDCEKLVRKVYLPPSGGRFACRQCLDLSYRSRQETRDPWGRAWRKIHAIEHRLETEPMRWRTEMRLRLEMNEMYRQACACDPLPAFLARSDRLIAEIERPPGRPGRPSKQELRERQRAERMRSQEATACEARPPGRPKEKRAYVRRSPLVLSSPPAGPWAFCPHCRDRRALKRPRPVTFANGRAAIRGRCAVCGTQAARIVPQRQSVAVRETGADTIAM